VEATRTESGSLTRRSSGEHLLVFIHLLSCTYKAVMPIFRPLETPVKILRLHKKKG